MKIEVGDKLVFKGSSREVDSKLTPNSVWKVGRVHAQEVAFVGGGVWHRDVVAREFEPWAKAFPRTAQELADEPILDAASGQQKNEPAWKQDGGKPRMDLIAPELLVATANVLTYGAAKYDERNWEKGMSWGRVFGAMMRHLWAWWGGAQKDDETGYSHLHHAAACLMFLIAYEERKTGTDDRHG